jgi:hypothetical protein
LVNLSEQILGGIRHDPWFVVAAAREHSPGDARELVGERDSERWIRSFEQNFCVDKWNSCPG